MYSICCHNANDSNDKVQEPDCDLKKGMRCIAMSAMQEGEFSMRTPPRRRVISRKLSGKSNVNALPCVTGSSFLFLVPMASNLLAMAST